MSDAMASAAREITALLAEARRGDAAATDRLVPLLYGELRRLARALMARERRGGTLQPTALVHEAYLRLLGGRSADWQSRAHFMGAAARAMRRILVERARRRARLKRGGGGERVTLTDGVRRYEARPEELLSLDVALRDLRARDPAMAQVVELRYFGGLTADETAEVLSTSIRTIHRLWSAARAWLHRALETRPSAAPHGGIPGGGGGG